MSFVPSPPKSRHWTFTAVATALASPTIAWGVDRSYRSVDRCLRAHGQRISDSEADIPDACSGISGLLALLALIAIVYVAATAITGLCVGVAEGRHRHSFGHRRWFVVTVVGIAAPWALATYAAGYGIGRLVPPPAVDTSWAEGRDAAHRVLDFLSLGGKPGPVLAPGFLTEEPVYLDARLHYARHYGSLVTYTQTSAMRSDRRASSPALWSPTPSATAAPGHGLNVWPARSGASTNSPESCSHPPEPGAMRRDGGCRSTTPPSWNTTSTTRAWCSSSPTPSRCD